jgi:hypothetical protein
MTDAQRVRRSARITASTRRGVELAQLEPRVAVRGAHHRDVRPDSVEPNDAIHPAAFDRCVAFQLESEFRKERHHVREVVYDYAHVVHPLDRHVLDRGTRLARVGGLPLEGDRAVGAAWATVRSLGPRATSRQSHHPARG